MLEARYYKSNLELAYPIMLSFLGQSLVQFFDTLMVGRLGTVPLAAVAFSTSIITVFLVLGQGIGMGLTPLVGQSFARKETKRISVLFQNSISLNVLAGGAIVALLLLFVPFLQYFGQQPEVIEQAIPYFVITALSLFPAQIFLSFRHFMEGVGNTKATMVIIISANALNVILNYVFIFGKFGCPAMGAFGAGLSTFVARCLMPIAYLVYLLWHKHYRKYFKFFSRKNLQVYYHKNLLRIGFPIGMQLALECVGFSAVTIMMGWYSTVALAAYQVVLTFVTLTFQLACGVASSTTILVSHSFGRKEAKEVFRNSMSGFHLSFVLMGISTICFICFGRQLMSLFSTDAAVIAQGATLFIVAGLFELLDGAQATLLGALRGLNDVAKPMKYCFICYIFFAIPLAYVLGFVFDLGPCGILFSLCIGLGSVAVLYYRRLRKTISKITPEQ